AGAKGAAERGQGLSGVVAQLGATPCACGVISVLFGIGMMLGVVFVALALRLKNTPVPDVSAWESAKETVKNIACGNVG
ncbi:MAG TPA: hypothetical protein VK561_10900, partial [Bradyrhizobium sp.]|nr:hypothetical protein [Bradyrhizobium sp.]